MVYYYDPHYPAFASLFVLTGTILSSAIFSPEFWLHVLSHSALTTAFWFMEDERSSLQELPKDATFLTTGFLTFLIVFFSGQCYDRYQEMYKCCQTIDDSTKLYIRELITFMYQPGVRRQVMLSAKYMCACIFYFYFSISDGYVHDEEWDAMEQKGLLSPAEMKYIKKFAAPTSRGLVITSWSVRAAQHALRTEEMMKIYSPPERAAIMNRLDGHAVAQSKDMRRVGDLLALPVPYAYFHLLSFVMCLNFAMTNWYLVSHYHTPLSIGPFAAYVLVFLGLRKLSAALADPFRPEKDDRLQCAMPCVAFLWNAFHNIVTLMEALDEGAPDPQKRIELNEAPESYVDFEVNTMDLVHIGGANGWSHRDETLKFDPEMSTWQRIQKRLFIGDQNHVAFKWRQMDQDAYLSKWIKDDRMRTRSVFVPPEEKKDRNFPQPEDPQLKELSATPMQAIADLQAQQKALVGMLETRLPAELKPEQKKIEVPADAPEMTASGQLGIAAAPKSRTTAKKNRHWKKDGG